MSGGHLGVSILFLLAACSGPQVIEAPPGFPAVDAGWAPLLPQIPASADIIVVAELGAETQRSLTEGIAGVGPGVGWADRISETLSDILGVDLDGSQAFEHLGLRPGGGIAAFRQGVSWVAILDLAEPDAAISVVNDLSERNPDWVIRWSEDDDGRRFSVAPVGADDPFLHGLVSDSQAILVHTPPVHQTTEVADSVIEQVWNKSWPESGYHAVSLIEAIGDLGDTPLLAVAQTATLLAVAGPMADANYSNVGRCGEIEAAVSRAIPRVAYGFRRLPSDVGHGPRDERRILLSVASEHQALAGSLLRPSVFDPDVIEQGAVLGGFAHLGTTALAEAFAQFADATDCAGLAGALGWLGRAGEVIAADPEIRSALSGEVMFSLFDLRMSAGVPFIDAFALFGSNQPDELWALLQRVLEGELGFNGTPDEIASLPTIQYRVALLYRLGIYLGPAAVGLSIGRVDAGWLSQVMTRQEIASQSFLHVSVDGPRLLAMMGQILDLAVGGDDEMAAAQDAMYGDTLGILETVRRYSLTGDLRDGAVRFESVLEAVAVE